MMAAADSNARLEQHTMMNTPLLVDLALSDWPNSNVDLRDIEIDSSRPIAAMRGRRQYGGRMTR
jgi:hypothetical protein